MVLMFRRSLLATILLCAWAGSAGAQAMPSVRVRGTIASLTGNTLSVTSTAGATQTLLVPPESIVTQLVATSLDAVKPGSFIGTAAVPGKGGTLVALEVHVFPESMRGTGEGHRPFDLKPESTMTNGTVGDVVGTVGRTLTVRYQGGEQTVQVPPDTPIVTFEPGSHAQLTPGAHVIVFATKAADGALQASRILVGKDGLVPPM
jgi:hypothetical protein